MDLKEIRNKIDKIDLDLKKSFLERMDLSIEVSEIKMKTNDEIYKPDREIQMINNLVLDVDEEIKDEYISFIKKIIGLSRQRQYISLIKSNSDKVNKVLEIYNVKENTTNIEIKFSSKYLTNDIAPIMNIILNYGLKINKIDISEKQCLIYIVEKENKIMLKSMIYQVHNELKYIELKAK